MIQVSIGAAPDFFCETDDFIDNALVYVAGYVCKRVLAKHSCTQCFNTLIETKTVDINKDHIFMAAKAYSTEKGIFGGLTAPSEFAHKLISDSENVFIEQFDQLKYESGIRRKIIDAISIQRAISTISVTPINIDHSGCLSSTISSIIDLYIRMRLHYKLKFINRSLRNVVKRKNKKAAKIMHQ
jgi:hypothetical protein